MQMIVEQIHTVENIVANGIRTTPSSVGTIAGSADGSLESGLLSLLGKESVTSRTRSPLVASFSSAIDSNIVGKRRFGSSLYNCRRETETPCGPHSSAPAGHRSRELNFCAEHPEAFANLVGQWVALEDETIVASGPDLAAVAAEARKRGVKVPFVFRVEEPLPAGYGELGL